MNRVRLTIRTISGTPYSTEVDREVAQEVSDMFAREQGTQGQLRGTFTFDGMPSVTIARRHVESVVIEEIK